MSGQGLIENIFPLTSMQQGMLFHSMDSENPGIYTEQTVIETSGNFNPGIFTEVFRILIEKYSVLRTAFVYKNVSVPKQVVLKERDLKTSYYDISSFPPDGRKKRFEEILKEDKNSPFDLEKDTLIRLSFIKTEEGKHTVLWSFHHIIMDGWCLGIILKDIADLYEDLSNDGKDEIKVHKPSSEFSDYITWLGNQDDNKALYAWGKYLEGFETPSFLYKNEERKGLLPDRQSRIIQSDSKSLARIKEICRNFSITENSFYLTVWGIIHQKFGRNNDSIFGNVVSGRNISLENASETVGLFINTVPVRVKTRDEATFMQTAELLQKEYNMVRDYEYLSLTEIQKITPLKDNLINSLFVFENYPVSDVLQELREDNRLDFIIENIYSVEDTNYDICLVINPNRENPFELKYSQLYSNEDIDIIAEVLLSIIDQVSENPDIKIKEIETVNESMAKRMDEFQNFENIGFPEDLTIIDIFHRKVQEYPEKTACEYGDAKLTYLELNNEAEKLASKIKKKIPGIKGNIGILLEPSLEMIVSIIAVLKTGNCYLPVDTEYPSERKNFMLSDSSVKLLITENEYLKDTDWNKATLLISEILPGETGQIPAKDSETEQAKSCPSDPAYIIYTSGSTGKPKGTLISNKNVVRLLYNDKPYFNFSENDIWSISHSFCFDFSVWEMYGALLFGGTAVIVPKETRMNPKSFADFVVDKKITIFNQTPLSFYRVSDALTESYSKKDLTLRFVIFGGEALAPEKLYGFKKRFPDVELINMYGITETTVHVTYKKIGWEEIRSGISNIGLPIPTLSVYILDENHRRVPFKVPGEICVSGHGVSLGYINREDLNREKFIENKFSGNSKLYCSGDLGRILENGEIEYLGRIDNQIKIRGFRIETGEIETRMRAFGGIRNAVVLAKTNGGEVSLNGYIESSMEINLTELRDELSKSLPYYMIPTFFITMEKFPYTSNNKINRKELLSIETVIESLSEYEEGKSDAELKMIEAWEKVLSKKKVGRRDNFFECGGDSIKAIQIVSYLKKSKLTIGIKDIMKNPQLSRMSLFIKDEDFTAEQGEISGDIPFTPIQLEFLKYNKSADEFNHTVLLETQFPVDGDIIEKALKVLTSHHDVLRMGYEKKEGLLRQYNHISDSRFPGLEVININNSDYDSAEEEIRRVYTKNNRELDFLKGPLLKPTLFKSLEKSWLMLIINHMIVDGVSWRVILEDLNGIYAALSEGRKPELQAKTTSYREYSENLQKYADTDEVKNEIGYWNNLIFPENKVSCGIKSPENDFNHIDTSNIQKDSISVTVYLTEEETSKLINGVNKKYGTETGEILLLAVSRAAMKWDGGKISPISYESHGRNMTFKNMDVSRTVGWFTVNFPVKAESHCDDLSLDIRSFKEIFRKTPDYGFNYSVLKYLTDDERIKFKDFCPKYSFNYMGEVKNYVSSLFLNSSTELPNATGANIITPFEIDINSITEKGIFKTIFRASQNKYSEGEIKSLAEIFISELRLILNHCTATGDKVLSPSDLVYSDFTIEELDGLMDDLMELENFEQSYDMEETDETNIHETEILEESK